MVKPTKPSKRIDQQKRVSSRRPPRFPTHVFPSSSIPKEQTSTPSSRGRSSVFHETSAIETPIPISTMHPRASESLPSPLLITVSLIPPSTNQLTVWYLLFLFYELSNFHPSSYPGTEASRGLFGTVDPSSRMEEICQPAFSQLLC